MCIGELHVQINLKRVVIGCGDFFGEAWQHI
jgi:hypothetical protein